MVTRLRSVAGVLTGMVLLALGVLGVVGGTWPGAVPGGDGVETAGAGHALPAPAARWRQGHRGSGSGSGSGPGAGSGDGVPRPTPGRTVIPVAVLTAPLCLAPRRAPRGRLRRLLADVGDDWRSLLLGAPPALG
ncbi:MAG TPA: hypothetical protein VIL36_01510 [Acidimicrobiales bacterium]